MFLPSTTVTSIGNSSNVCSESLLVKVIILYLFHQLNFVFFKSISILSKFSVFFVLFQLLLSIVRQELCNILDWMLRKNPSVLR